MTKYGQKLSYLNAIEGWLKPTPELLSSQSMEIMMGLMDLGRYIIENTIKKDAIILRFQYTLSKNYNIFIFFYSFRIGMNGFDNPMRDQKTEDIKALIGQGCKVKMDGTGNILVKRLARSPVYVKNTVYEENAVSNDILKLPNSGLLEPIDKPFKLFDMKKFQQVWKPFIFLYLSFKYVSQFNTLT